MSNTFDPVAEIENLFRDARNRTEQKKKMKQLMARYGDTVQDIENSASPAEYMEFMIAGGADMLEQVKTEKASIRRDTYGRQSLQQPANFESSLNAALEGEEEETSQPETAEKKEEKTETKIQRLFKLSKEHLGSKKGEGSADNPYLDTTGHITIGKGKMVNDKKSFVALNLRNGNRAATKEEKEQAYDKFQELIAKGKYGKDYRAKYYEQYTPLRMSAEAIDDLLNTHLLNDIANLRRGIPNFDNLPLELQEVLVDIRYNTGAITQTKWPKLRKAIQEKDLTAIAKEVHRKNVSKTRNDWAREKIESISGWGKRSA